MAAIVDASMTQIGRTRTKRPGDETPSLNLSPSNKRNGSSVEPVNIKIGRVGMDSRLRGASTDQFNQMSQVTSGMNSITGSQLAANESYG